MHAEQERVIGKRGKSGRMQVQEQERERENLTT